jgi:23S rRNA pseudouridine1911/1915/1917 synthase
LNEIVPAALDGERIDRVVALLTGLARSQVVRLVDQGEVHLNGSPVIVRSRRVQAGELLTVEVPGETVTAAPLPDPDVPVQVVHDDHDVIVVNKPPGLVVHPGAGHERGTLVNGLLARFPDLAEAEGANLRPGIVHRLDKGTSGLLVVARTPSARDSLMRQLRERKVEREYAALVWGSVEAGSGLIDAPLGRAAAHPTKVAIRSGGKPARTRYRVERRFSSPAAASLLDCRLETGRTHQIRVHLAAIGHPVAGDLQYSGRQWPAGLPRLAPGRVWLHARRLSFEHPVTGQSVTFVAPLPVDLESVLAALS